MGHELVQNGVDLVTLLIRTQMTFFFKVERGIPMTKSIKIEFISIGEFPKASIRLLNIDI